MKVPVGPSSQPTQHPHEKEQGGQKLVLNMISTAMYGAVGQVEDNKMVNMQLAMINSIGRGVKMVMQKLSGIMKKPKVNCSMVL